MDGVFWLRFCAYLTLAGWSWYRLEIPLYLKIVLLVWGPGLAWLYWELKNAPTREEC